MKTYLDSKAAKSWKVKGSPDFALVGFPSSLGAITKSGQDSAPDYIRGFSSHPLKQFADDGQSTDVGKLRDLGNLYFATPNQDAYLEDISWAVSTVAKKAKCVVAIGGDDSISYGVAEGLSEVHGDIGIVHYDAHTDTYGEEESVDHGNWIAHAHDHLGLSINQRGCRTDVDKMPYQESIENKPLFISVDMDVIDPSFAPGVSCPYPLGLTPQDVLEGIDAICKTHRVVGFALNEVNVDRDVNGMTGHLAHLIIWRAMSKIRLYEAYI